VFLMAMAHLVYPTTFVLYADFRFGWGLQMVGWTLLIVGVLSMIVQGALIGRIVRRLGERRTLLLGAACGAIGFALYGLAPSGYWFWAAMPIAAFWALANPAAQALMTRQVSAQEQGRLQGAVGSLNAIAGILAPTLFTQTLAVVAHAGLPNPWAGATFWLAAALVALGGAVAWRASSQAASQPARA
jgi:DHA1 family tetracycline resistance protein-like MFS transporter